VYLVHYMIWASVGFRQVCADCSVLCSLCPLCGMACSELKFGSVVYMSWCVGNGLCRACVSWVLLLCAGIKDDRQGVLLEDTKSLNRAGCNVSETSVRAYR